MAYQALYRKWRPQTFDAVVGQNHITETLKNQVVTGRLSHAYLFIGTRGTGKTTCARILAKAVNCQHPVDGNPCCRCASCLAIQEGAAPDIVEIDAASNNGVDNVRALRDEAVYSPSAVKKRVYIIDEVHMLSLAAFNALLKILEEPPAHLMFILATTELQKVPATILSRCQRHSFKRVDADTLAAYLKQIAGRESFPLTDEAAGLIAKLSEGGVRDALSILDQCSAAGRIDADAVCSTLGLAGQLKTAQLLEAALSHDMSSVLSLFNALWMDGKDPTGILNELRTLLRDILVYKVAPGEGKKILAAAYSTDTLKSFSARMTSEELIASMESIQRTMDNMKTSPNPRNMAELCLISLTDPALSGSGASLAARVSRLEERLRQGIPAAAPQKEQESYRAVSAPSGAAAVSPSPVHSLDLPQTSRQNQAPTLPMNREPGEDPAVDNPPAACRTEPLNGPVPTQGGDARELWKQICERVRPDLPGDLRTVFDDPENCRFCLSGSHITLQLDSFISGRYRRVNLPERIAQCARQITGISYSISITDIRQAPPEQPPSAGNLRDLAKYPEVKFNN